MSKGGIERPDGEKIEPPNYHVRHQVRHMQTAPSVVDYCRPLPKKKQGQQKEARPLCPSANSSFGSAARAADPYTSRFGSALSCRDGDDRRGESMNYNCTIVHCTEKHAEKSKKKIGVSTLILCLSFGFCLMIKCGASVGWRLTLISTTSSLFGCRLTVRKAKFTEIDKFGRKKNGARAGARHVS